MPEQVTVSALTKAYQGTSEAVLTDLLRYCQVYEPNMAKDVVAMARQEGRRQVGLYILLMLGEARISKEDLCRKKM